MTRLSTRAVGAVLAAALVPAGALALTPAPASASAHGSAPHLVVEGTKAAELRVVLTAAFQAHDALANVTAATYVRKGTRLGAAAEAVTARSRQSLARVVGGDSPGSAALRDAVAASDRAKTAYALSVDRYGRYSRTQAAQAEDAVAIARGRVAGSLSSLVPGLTQARAAQLLAVTDAADAAAARALG